MPPHYRGLPCGQRDDTTDFNLCCRWRQFDCNGKQQRREREQKNSQKKGVNIKNANDEE